MEDFDFQGHRGARGLAPENTIPSFLKALEYGVTTLELDVVISKDSQIVLSHEPWFNHSISTHPEGKVITKENEKEFNLYQMVYDEIKTYDVGKIGNPRFPQQAKQEAVKPTLRMVTDVVSTYLMEKNLEPVYYNIETKSQPDRDDEFHPAPKEFVRLLYNEIQNLGIAEYTTIQSFDVRTLEALHQLDTSITTALLIYHEDESITTTNLEKDLATLSFKPDIYSCYYIYLTEELIAQAHQKGIKIIPWTVNEKEDMQRLIEMGVDGLITDYPDRLRELLDAGR
jgi:glycerophosphoryl diester phosphodiesterase